VFAQDVFASLELLKTLAAAAASLGTGVVATYSYQRLRALSARSRATSENLVNLIKSREDENKAAVLTLLAERLPPHTNVEDFFGRLEPLVNKLMATAPARSEPLGPVEGLVGAYHEQALNQARVQYWFSILAATVGFSWILYSAGQINPAELATTARLLPGSIVDAVAYLFLKQASETRQRATELYDRLRKDRELSDSVVLVTSIEDPKVRSAVRAQVALHMAGLQPEPINLTPFLTGEKTNP
jgi:hypothetical protein